MKIRKLEISPRETNKWDWIVPIGLSGILIILWAFVWLVYHGSLGNETTIGVIFFLMTCSIATFFLSRFQRIFVFPILGVIGLVWQNEPLGLFASSIIGLGYTFGTLTLLIAYGNNPSQKGLTPKSLLRRSLEITLASGVFGLLLIPTSFIFGFAFPVFLGPFKIYNSIYEQFSLIFPEQIAGLLTLIIWFLFFALIGLVIDYFGRKLIKRRKVNET